MRFARRCGDALFTLLGAALSTGLYAVVPAAHADDALDKMVAADIPAESLTDALILLSRQSGTQILMPANLVGERKTDGVHGRMPVREALSTLFKGSPLGFHAAGENTIGIDPVPAMPGRDGPAHGGDAATGGQDGAATVTAVAVVDAPAPGPDAGRQPAALGEVIVTATKREQSSRKIPATVNVLRGKDLEDIGARDMQDFLKYVPGVTLQEGETNNSRTISIRGIGPQPGANTTVGSLIDDVSMGDPYSSYLVPDLDPFDLHDLEILKGPQGTLFGASALNGAIRYVLNKPLLGEWEAKGFADWLHIQGNGSGPTYGGAVNIPIGEKLAFRVVDVLQSVPGLYDDVNVNGKNQRDADDGYKRMHRFLGTWQPTDKLSVNAFYLQQQNHRNDLSIANNLDSVFVRTDTPGPSSSTQHFSVANLDIRYNFDFATLISETSHTTKLQDLDYDTSPLLEAFALQGVQSFRTNEVVRTNSISQELRLVSAPGDSPWVWIGGAYWNHYSAKLSDNILVSDSTLLAPFLAALGIVVPPGAPPGQTILAEDVEYAPLHATEESLFGELTRKLFDSRLQLTVGGRLYRETLLSNVQIGGLLAPISEAAGYAGPKTMKSSGFNPKASVSYQITPDLLWYSNATHGFQFGGINEPSPVPADNTFSLAYRPSKIWSYETGMRFDALHKKLQFDLTAFLLNWKDMQIQQRTPDGVTDYTANIGSARSKGLESSIRYLTPIPGLMLINVTSYIHAKVAASYTTSEGEFVPAGTDLPAAPRLQTTTTLAYSTVLGPVRTGAELSYSHQGRAFNDIEHEASIYGYNTLDLGYHLTFPQVFLSPSFTLNATNLSNAHALVGAQINRIGTVPDGVDGAFLRPRTIALRISGQF